MIKYPESLRRAQEEVDGLCGAERSPTSDDLNELPYLKACMIEVNRLPCHFITSSDFKALDIAMAACSS
jgi:hypothetical protein